MALHSIMEVFAMAFSKVLKFAKSVNMKVCIVSMAAAFLLMCLTSINTILNTASIGSIPDAFPLTEYFMILIVFCALAFQESEKEHIRVDMFVVMLPKKLGKIVNIVFDLLTFGAVSYLSYAYFTDVPSSRLSGSASSLLKVPEWPFKLIVGIAVALFAITILLDTIEHFLPDRAEAKTDKEEMIKAVD